MADESWRVPPIVQELAAGVDEPPSRYVQREQDRPAVGAEMPEPIPVVDVSRLSAADGGVEMTKLLSALQNWGFFLAVEHEIETTLLDAMTNVMREFFQLPLEEKQKYSNLVNGKEYRIEGYGSGLVTSENQILDWCDRFFLIVEPESHKLHYLWPIHPASFKDVLNEYTIKCRKVVNSILRNLAKLVSLGEDYFVDLLGEDAVTYARLNYYPPCPRPDHVFGLKPHSDASMVTIIFVDDNVSGLQVLNNGVWYNVPLVPNSLFVNLGDTMEIMSNGIFKSPMHRVVTNADKERLSVALFYTLDPEKKIEPAQELVDEKRPRLYGKTKTNDYMTAYTEAWTRGTRAIDTLKISTSI